MSLTSQISIVCNKYYCVVALAGDGYVLSALIFEEIWTEFHQTVQYTKQSNCLLVIKAEMCFVNEQNSSRKPRIFIEQNVKEPRLVTLEFKNNTIIMFQFCIPLLVLEMFGHPDCQRN